MKTPLSSNVSQILTEAIEEVRNIPKLEAQASKQLDHGNLQLSLLHSHLSEVRGRLKDLSGRFGRTRVGRTVSKWGGESDLDWMIFLAAFACDSGGVSLSWPSFFAAALADPIERLLGISRVKFFSKYVNPWRCSLKEEVLDQVLGLDHQIASDGSFFEVRSPQVGLDRLALEPTVAAHLRRLVHRLATSSKVLEDWGMSSAHRSAVGGGALFYGAPGTGKTLAAEGIASELGLNFFLLDSSSIQSKWVGDTEKNLSAAFRAAERQNTLLFIDEADGLLGQRTSVTRSTDAFRNNIIETLLLLIEARVQPTIVASNFEDALDPALRRRLSTRIEFPRPSETVRRRLWELHIPCSVPVDGGIEINVLVALPLSGGEISQVVMMAACQAAAEGRGLRTQDLVDAAHPWISNERAIGFKAV